MMKKKFECLYRPLKFMKLFESTDKGYTLRQIETETHIHFSNIIKMAKPFVDKGYIKISDYSKDDCQKPVKSYAHRMYFITEKGLQLREEIETLIYMFENIICNIYSETPKSLNSSCDINNIEVNEND